MIDFTAAYAGIKFAKDALKFTLDQTVDQKVKEKVSEALEKIGKVQDDLFQVREDLLRLQEENHKLAESLREKESWNTRMSDYSLVAISGGSTIYQSSSEPKHFICPSCTEKKEIHILQRTNDSYVSCPSCKTSYQTKKTTKAIGGVSYFSR